MLLHAIQSCLEGYTFLDILRGIGLITRLSFRLSFRPSSIRNLLASTPSSIVPRQGTASSAP